MSRFSPRTAYRTWARQMGELPDKKTTGGVPGSLFIAKQLIVFLPYGCVNTSRRIREQKFRLLISFECYFTRQVS